MERIEAWLESAGRGGDAAGLLFRAMAGKSPAARGARLVGHARLSTPTQYCRPGAFRTAPEARRPTIPLGHEGFLDEHFQSRSRAANEGKRKRGTEPCAVPAADADKHFQWAPLEVPSGGAGPRPHLTP